MSTVQPLNMKLRWENLMSSEAGGSPERIHGIFTAFLQSQAVFTAIELGIFEALAEEPGTFDEVAKRVGLNVRPVRALLIALEGLRLVETLGASYRNSDEASKYLVASSPDFMGKFAEHQRVHFKNFYDLPSAARNNTSVTKRVLRDGYSNQGSGLHEGDEGRARFLEAARVSSRIQAGKLARALQLSPGSTIVDLGCGSGDYSIAIAKQHPTVHVYAMDYPAAAEIAARNIVQADLADRVTVLPGDIAVDDLPCTDAALFCHVLDGYGRAQAKLLIEKVVNGLRPGGRVYVHSHMPDLANGLFPSLFGLILLVNTETGEVYKGSDITDLLESVGLVTLGKSKVSFLSGLIQATKPE